MRGISSHLYVTIIGWRHGSMGICSHNNCPLIQISLPDIMNKETSAVNEKVKIESKKAIWMSWHYLKILDEGAISHLHLKGENDRTPNLQLWARQPVGNQPASCMLNNAIVISGKWDTIIKQHCNWALITIIYCMTKIAKVLSSFHLN